MNHGHGNLRSFNMPFFCMRNVKLEQPLFGANYMKGTSLAQDGGNFQGDVVWKMTFPKGGCIEFGQALLRATDMGMLWNHWFAILNFFQLLMLGHSMHLLPMCPLMEGSNMLLLPAIPPIIQSSNVLLTPSVILHRMFMYMTVLHHMPESSQVHHRNRTLGNNIPGRTLVSSIPDKILVSSILDKTLVSSIPDRTLVSSIKMLLTPRISIRILLILHNNIRMPPIPLASFICLLPDINLILMPLLRTPQLRKILLIQLDQILASLIIQILTLLRILIILWGKGSVRMSLLLRTLEANHHRPTKLPHYHQNTKVSLYSAIPVLLFWRK